MLTWRDEDARRMESVRVQLSGKRIKANGRIVAASTETNPAFAAYYDLLTDETGATKRLGMTVTSAERERQLVVARDNENMWLITDHQGDSRSAYDGALDVDVVFSPFFNALPIRRLGLTENALTVTVPTVYINLPAIAITSAPISYSSPAPGSGEGIKVHSPVSDTVLTVDEHGFIVDYPSLATRI
jgi:uncharacterized protein